MNRPTTHFNAILRRQRAAERHELGRLKLKVLGKLVVLALIIVAIIFASL